MLDDWQGRVGDGSSRDCSRGDDTSVSLPALVIQPLDNQVAWDDYFLQLAAEPAGED